DTVGTIWAPDGTLVKDTFWVGHAPGNRQWMNVAAHRGGFVVRCNDTNDAGFIFFYDNIGNFRFKSSATIALPSGGAFTTDASQTRLASDVRSDYVYVAGPVGAAIKLGVWDARTGAFVTDASVTSDLDSTATVGNTELADDALDQV